MPSVSDLRRAHLLSQLGLSSSTLSESDLQTQLYNNLKSDFASQTFALDVGESTMPRKASMGTTTSLQSGTLFLTYFVASKSETVNTVRAVVGNTAASGLTFGKMGLYSVDTSTGALTLLASTANDTNLFTVASSENSRALNTSVNKIKGNTYAVGILCIGTTMPSLTGYVLNVVTSKSPRMAGGLTGQVDLPANISVPSYSGTFFYSEVA